MEKGTSVGSRNPFYNPNGAEGGTRTPTGFPTTPVKLVPMLRVAGARWIRVLYEPR